MIGDDDLDSFFDPDEFGTSAELVSAGERRPVEGMLLTAQPPTSLQRAGQRGAGLRVRPGERLYQLPLSSCPASFEGVVLSIEGLGVFDVVDQLPAGAGLVNLCIIAHGPAAAVQGGSNGSGSWLRD